MSADEAGKTAIQILIHIVLPVGSAIWAFTQTPFVEHPAVGWALLLIAAIGLFYGFRHTIKMADDRLNRRAQA